MKKILKRDNPDKITVDKIKFKLFNFIMYGRKFKIISSINTVKTKVLMFRNPFTKLNVSLAKIEAITRINPKNDMPNELLILSPPKIKDDTTNKRPMIKLIITKIL